ncbi:MAG TPA: hypothetical protein VLE97_05510 [Gaiellaceae bacterium]|nr:hypothetical protein [Gaiellaceae bacterium]
MAPDSVWEIVFLMVILKIPIVYLCGVVYYAIKAKPTPEAGAGVTASIGGPDQPGSWHSQRRLRNLRPRGGPSRTYARTPRPVQARAEVGRR